MQQQTPAFDYPRPPQYAPGIVDEPQDALTIADVAKRLDVSEQTVRRLIARGELRTYQIGRLVRISMQSYQEYLKKALNPPPSED